MDKISEICSRDYTKHNHRSVKSIAYLHFCREVTGHCLKTSEKKRHALALVWWQCFASAKDKLHNNSMLWTEILFESSMCRLTDYHPRHHKRLAHLISSFYTNHQFNLKTSPWTVEHWEINHCRRTQTGIMCNSCTQMNLLKKSNFLKNNRRKIIFKLACQRRDISSSKRD